MKIIPPDFWGVRRAKLIKRHATLLIAIMIVGCFALGAGFAQETKQPAGESLERYLSLAQQGNAEAQAKVADLYREGKSVAQNVPEAIKWYTKAAQQGLAVAQYKLGEMYRDGQGIAKDSKEAMKWFQKAADQGYEAAKGEIKKLGTVPAEVIDDLNKLVDMMR